MTITPEEFLVDPGEAFLAAGPQELERATPEEMSPLTKAAIGLGAAFVLYRVFMAKELATEPPPAPGAAQDLVLKVWTKVAPLWAQAALPAVIQAYRLGGASSVSASELEQLAEAYVDGLGEHINRTSMDAMVEGYNAGLSTGWSERLAWVRATNGYGLDKRGMGSYISGMIATKGSYQTEIIPDAAQQLVNALVLKRGDLIGREETWSAKEMGKALLWADAVEKGMLPPGSMKRWATARDERVCPICGPMDSQTVGLRDKFTSPDGNEVHAPTMHVNCRCTIEIVYPEYFTKALGDDPFDRDRQGRFARTEQRTRKIKLKERVTPDEFDQMLREAVLAEQEQAVTSPFTTESPFTTATESPFAVDSPFVVANPFQAPVEAPVASPFAGDSPFESVFAHTGTKRRRRVYLLTPGTKEADAQEVDVEETDHTLRWNSGEKIYALGDQVINDKLTAENRLAYRQDEYNGGDLQAGDTVDFDDYGQHEGAPAVLGTVAGPAASHEVMHDLLANSVTEGWGADNVDEFYEEYWQAQEDFESHIYQEADKILGLAPHNQNSEFYSDYPPLSDDEVRTIFFRAGLKGSAAKQDPQSLRMKLVNAIWGGMAPADTPEKTEAFRDDVLVMEYAQFMRDARPTPDMDYVQEAIGTMQTRSHDMDAVYTPTVFVFDQGVSCDWIALAGRDRQPLIKGQYKVASVKTRHVGDRIGPKKGLTNKEGLNPNIFQYYEVRLVPNEDWTVEKALVSLMARSSK